MAMTRRGLTRERYRGGPPTGRLGAGRAARPDVSDRLWATPDGVRAVDVWEAAEHFRRFADQRLMPVVKGGRGFAGEPEVTSHEAYAVFIPALQRG
jgi:hypothetical protein